MNSTKTISRVAVLLGALMIAAAGLTYGQTKPVASGNVTFTVTVVGKKEMAPSISKDEVQLFQGKERKQIADWKKEDKLFLAILIDDSIDSGAASNWNDLKGFIMAQPPSTYIAVGYLRNNATMVVQDFTNNHELAAKALRMPIGVGGIGSSPWLATMDMLKRWPDTGVRRSVMLISSGIDYFRGDGFGTIDPDLDPLIQRAERQNTNIWSIYFPSAGHRGRSFYVVTYAQNNLDKLAEDTGAESFFLGMGVPVSLKPYFDEIAQHLNNQYLLTFAGPGGSKGQYKNMKVKTETPDMEFMTPAAVYFPPVK